MLDCGELFAARRIPDPDAVIGAAGQGWNLVRGGLAKERTFLAAICVGVADADAKKVYSGINGRIR